MARRWWARVLVYLGLSMVLTWPAVAELGRCVPGAQRTDLWNSLWSLWFLADSVTKGLVPYHTQLLDSPDGGSILVTDLFAGVFGAPLLPWLGLPLVYTLLVLLRVAFSGLMAHGFADDLLRARDLPVGGAWVAGVGYASAPVLLAGIHNGTSEAFDGGWAALAAWLCWRVAVRGGWGRALWAGVALLFAALSSWYGAVVAFLFAGALLVLGAGDRWRRHLGARAGALLLGIVLVAPFAAAVHAASVAPDNLVGIKVEREVRTVRRSVGPADPVGYLAPGDYRSPDFRELSKYSEGFFHCHYLGWVLLLGAGLSLRRARGTGFIWLAGVTGLLLSLGPVLARFGSAVIIFDGRAIPLPYLLVENLPGFSSLSLLFRLAQAPALAVALLAAIGFASRRAWGLAVAGILLEGRLLSPLGSLPDTVDVRPAAAIVALADAPPGAVMNFPVAGGRAYLYEQTLHHHPIAGTLNFPNNIASRKVWKTMLDHLDDDPEAFRAATARAARAQGIRYVVVHIDPMARPDMHDAAVRKMKQVFDPISGSEGSGTAGTVTGTAVRVYALW